MMLWPIIRVMSQPATVLFRIWIYLKPHTSDTLVYRTFEAALRACTVEDGEITEWIATEESPRMRPVCTWIRRSGSWLECTDEHINDTG